MTHIIEMSEIKPVDVQVARSINKYENKAITAEIDMIQEVMHFIVWRDSDKIWSGYSLREAIAAYNVA